MDFGELKPVDICNNYIRRMWDSISGTQKGIKVLPGGKVQYYVRQFSTFWLKPDCDYNSWLKYYGAD